MVVGPDPHSSPSGPGHLKTLKNDMAPLYADEGPIVEAILGYRITINIRLIRKLVSAINCRAISWITANGYGTIGGAVTGDLYGLPVYSGSDIDCIPRLRHVYSFLDCPQWHCLRARIVIAAIHVNVQIGPITGCAGRRSL
jgi:hypothetical protein